MKWIKPFGATSSDERYHNAEPTVAGSNPDAAFFNTVLDELLGIITAADMEPDESANQVAAAIVALAERAATSGVIRGSYWFAKTKSNTTAPAPTMVGQNYIDFTTLKTYISNNGTTWTENGTFVKPAGIDFTILITSRIWDIPEQDGQQGGWAQYNHTDDEWSWWPKIISFQNAALTGVPTAPTLTTSSAATQIANKQSVSNAQGVQGLKTTSSTVALADDKTIYVIDATSSATLTITLNRGAISVPTNSAKTFEIHVKAGATVPTVTWNTVDKWLIDSATRPVASNKTAIFAIRIQNVGGTITTIGNYGGAY